MNKFKILMLLFSAMVLLGSCSDDDPEIPADADDNFITSLTLTVADGTSYTAVIEDQILEVSVPYNVSLQGASADMKYTASATIFPDPATISDWDNEQIFRVKSYNGDVNEYTYRVNHKEITQEGDVELKTMSEIAAFADAGTSVVNGNLTIGTDEGENITSIENLANLKEVKGNLILKNSFKATDLTGLENVTTLGGLIVGSTDAVSDATLNLVTMKALSEITGDLILRNNSLKWTKLDALQKVGGDIIIASTSLESIETPALTEIGGNLDLCGITEITEDEYGNVNMGGSIVELSFPALSRVGGVVKINYFATLTTISLPQLTTAGSIEIPTLGHQFETIDLSSLTAVEQNLAIESVRTSGRFASDAANNTTLKSLGDLSKLQTVGESLRIVNFSGMTTLPDFASLKSVKTIYLGYVDVVENNLDLSNVTFTKDSKIEIKNRCSIPAIIGSGDMAGEILLSTTASHSASPDIKGFTSVHNVDITLGSGLYLDNEATIVYDFETVTGNFKFTYDVSATLERGNTLQFPNLKEVKGAFVIASPGSGEVVFQRLDAPVLETIGGQFCSTLHVAEYYLPALTTVGCAENAELLISDRETSKVKGNGMMDIALGKTVSLDFPVLKKIGGNGLYINCKQATMETVTFPAIATIAGELYVFGHTSSIKNKYVKKLSFPELEQVPKVTIQSFTNMSDYSTFATVINNGSITESNWLVTNCGYNPTYEDMQAGRYTQQ